MTRCIQSSDDLLKACLLGLALGLVRPQALPAHDTDLPAWMKSASACIVDLRESQGSLKVELSLSRRDALALLGAQRWQGPASLAALAPLIAAGVRVNGAQASAVRPLAPSPRHGFERWQLSFAGPLPSKAQSCIRDWSSGNTGSPSVGSSTRSTTAPLYFSSSNGYSFTPVPPSVLNKHGPAPG